MKVEVILTPKEANFVSIANDWIKKNKEYLKHCKFTKKELIQIGKNILNNNK